MQPRTNSTRSGIHVSPRHDLAITTRFLREPVDADDTVPVELYSRPYERLEIQAESKPYERIEIEMEVDIEEDADAICMSASSNLAAANVGDLVDLTPSWVRLVLAISILCCAFAVGVGFAVLVL